MNLNADFSSESELNERLDLIYQQAKLGKTFHGLFEIAFNEVTITTSIHKIKANKGANTPGVDKIKMERYLQMDKNELISLIRKTVSNYRPKPVKRVYIEKANGKKRPLGIPTIMDRIIQECIRMVIEPIVEAKLYPHSYGFRKYRATKHAVRQVIHFATSGKAYYAIEGDIEGYFDNINHRTLLQKLWRIGIKDKRVLILISQMLKAGYLENDLLNKTEDGTPQGGIISPLLANIYLNDFDWMISRRYIEPFMTDKCNMLHKQREKMRRNGRNPCYLVRYADDWIILTKSLQEANRLLGYLRKYFKHKLKLNLSKEKTVVTNLRNKPALFLGFDIIVEAPRKFKGCVVGKNYPNPKKVSKQIQKICAEIHRLRDEPKDEFKVLQIAKINSMLEGVAEYWKTGICNKTLNRIDFAVNNSLFHTFKKMYPDSYMEHKVQLKQLDNRPDRHKNYKMGTFAIQYQNFIYGVTLAKLTHSKWEMKPFNQLTSPYTKVGRELYQATVKRRMALERPNINTVDNLKFALLGSNKYNFEYHMNREYAFNRDKGKCKVCNKSPGLSEMECHHTYPKYPISQVNRVPNLAWVCKTCHEVIHGSEFPNWYDSKMIKKATKFREKLTNELKEHSA